MAGGRGGLPEQVTSEVRLEGGNLQACGKAPRTRGGQLGCSGCEGEEQEGPE